MLLLIITGFYSVSYAQNIGERCNNYPENASVLSSINSEILFLDYGDFPKYSLPDMNTKMFITNRADYESIRKAGTEQIDFNKYNFFIGIYYTEGANEGDYIRNRFEVRLIHDYNTDFKRIVIVETIAGASARKAIPYIIAFKIPKEDCENLEEICIYRNRIRQ
jgi:hypothetical protein